VIQITAWRTERLDVRRRASSVFDRLPKTGTLSPFADGPPCHDSVALVLHKPPDLVVSSAPLPKERRGLTKASTGDFDTVPAAVSPAGKSSDRQAHRDHGCACLRLIATPTPQLTDTNSRFPIRRRLRYRPRACVTNCKAGRRISRLGCACFAQATDLMPPKGAILLGEVAKHLAAVEISCSFCPRRGKASVLRLMHEHGSNMPIPDLLRLLSADCARSATPPQIGLGKT
jgi:hypothetical protein